MKIKQLVSRFLIPGHFVSLYYYAKFGCIVSPKAEVDISNNLIIGKKSQISSFVKMKVADGLLQIGERTDISVGCFLSSSPGQLVIGDDCLIGANCTILSNNYITSSMEYSFRDQGSTTVGTRIGNNVLVGANSVIVDGSIIGDGVVIAANSLVSGKIASNSIIQGNPARVIFTRR